MTTWPWSSSKPSPAEAVELPAGLEECRTWSELKTEPSGLASLSRVHRLTREANTVFARITVTSEDTQSKVLSFGYSDRVRVFLNVRLLYAGDNGFRTRDYRYLGTIGFFDSVVLPLTEGRNELWIAVSESFGGWGLQSAFEDSEGPTIVDRALARTPQPMSGAASAFLPPVRPVR